MECGEGVKSDQIRESLVNWDPMESSLVTLGKVGLERVMLGETG